MNLSSPDTGKILDFLDKAYDAPDNPERFDALMESAKAYFFGEEGLAPVADTTRLTKFDSHLAPHMARIQAMLDSAGSPPGREGAAFAQFRISRSGRITDGNKAASAFLDTSFPCQIDDLDLDFASKKRLRAALAGDGNPGQTDVIHLMTENTAEAAIGLCRQAGQGNNAALEISLSHVMWTEVMINAVGQALELTQAETDVMSGVLNGFAQAEIAEQRGRSLETVKVQSKAILRKSGCAKMSDVARLALSIAFLFNSAAPAPSITKELPAAAPQVLQLGGNRQLGYLTYGSPQGRPIIFIHGSLLGPFFTPRFIKGLTEMGATLYGPSRPGFGETTPARKNGYDEAAADDVLALCEAKDLRDVLLLTEHGGVSHAYRAAAQLGDRLKGMVMIGAGVPIEEGLHLPHMDRYTRIAAAAVKHTPSAMELVTRIAISTFRRRGFRKFFEDYFKESPPDLAALNDPDIYSVMTAGLEHLIQQGPKAFVVDGASQMADWRADFDRVRARALWLHAEDDPILPVQYVRDWVGSRTNHPVETVPEGGYNLLHTQTPRVLKILQDALTW